MWSRPDAYLGIARSFESTRLLRLQSRMRRRSWSYRLSSNKCSERDSSVDSGHRELASRNEGPLLAESGSDCPRGCPLRGTLSGFVAPPEFGDRRAWPVIVAAN